MKTMSQQQERTEHTTGRSRRRRRNTSQAGVQYGFLKKKKSNIPIGEESDNKKMEIMNWGAKNEYPFFLNFLFRKNSIHSGILRAKTFFTTAGGMEYNGADQVGYDAFFKNKKKSHLDKDLSQIAEDLSLDFEKSNMFAVKVYFSMIGGARKFRKIERIPFEKIRFEVTYDKEQNVFLTGNIRVSDNWLDEKTEAEILQPYRRNDETQYCCYVLHKEESGQSLDYVGANKINPGCYPDPPYGGAITAIDTGIQVDIHDNAEIHNGFSLGTLIYLANGRIKNPKKKKDLEADLGASTTGPLQAGRSMVIYGNGQNEKPTIESLNGNNLPERYQNTKKGSAESTVQGHSFTSPTLAGIKTEGSLGDSKELKTAYAILRQNYIKKRQDIISGVLTWIMNTIAEVEGQVSFVQVELEIPEEEPSTQPQFQVNMNSEKNGLSDQEKIMERLKALGRPKSDFQVLHSFSMKEGEKSKEQLVSSYKEQFNNLTDLQSQALQLIGNGESYDSIRRALEIDGMELSRIYQDLANADYITKKGEITSAGKTQVAVSEVESIEIMYEYRLRPEFDDPIIPGTRDFCREVLALNRLYTRAEINIISGVEGYDVFAFRGGWYHNPNTNKNEPGCRHEWAQVITFG